MDRMKLPDHRMAGGTSSAESKGIVKEEEPNVGMSNGSEKTG